MMTSGKGNTVDDAVATETATVRPLDDEGTYLVHARASKEVPESIERALSDLKVAVTEIRRTSTARQKSR